MGVGASAGRVTSIRSAPMAAARGGVPGGRRTALASAFPAISAARRATARRRPRIAVGEPASTRTPTVATAATAARAAPTAARASEASAWSPAPPTARLLAKRRRPTAVPSSPAAAIPIAGRCQRPADVARAPRLLAGPISHARAMRTVRAPRRATFACRVASGTRTCRAERTLTARLSLFAMAAPVGGRFARRTRTAKRRWGREPSASRAPRFPAPRMARTSAGPSAPERSGAARQLTRTGREPIPARPQPDHPWRIRHASRALRRRGIRTLPAG